MKKVLAISLSLCMLLPLFALLPVFAATPAEGFDFTGGDKWYYMDGTLPDAPRTVEAWIWVDPANATKTRTIISNYNGFTSIPYWHLAVKYTEADGLYPYFEWNELSNNSTSVRKFNFTKTKIEPSVWTHITVVIDAENNCCHCYKDGAYVQSNNAGIQLGDITRNVTELPLVIGNDCRPDLPDARVFGGKIASISIFNDVRTAAEIQSDFANGANYNDANAIAHWELPANGGAVTDKSGKSAGLTLSKYWLTEAEMQAIRGNDFNPAYSFAIVGDIQYMTEWQAENGGTAHVANLHKWIADNIASKNIKFMAGMGDVTNNNTAAEWQIAYEAIKQLNGKIPYSVINGNHDLYTGDGKVGPNGINSYFGADEAYMSQFAGENGGLYEEGSARNTYTKFTVGSTKWLFINLDYSPTDDILAWANRVVADHPDHKVVMTTHGYMHMDGTPLSHEDSSSMSYNSGEEMWTKFVSLHENIVMVLSGHMECNLLQMKQAKGVHGNTVTQFLIDQQTIDLALMNKGQLPLGLVAMFYFDEDGENVSVEWYSTTYDKYFQTRNQFSFNMNAESEEQIFPWDGLAVAPKGAGTESNPYIVENGGNLLWMANQIQQIDLSAGGTPSFENAYFKQVCDIDLDGLVIKSIGYYHTSQGNINKVAAFAGHYDGGGYSIKNGRVIPSGTSHESNINWCDGLFGCIYGATIENVTLDNVTIWSRGVTGGIVGRATAPRNTSPSSDFNVISNCHIKSNCRIVSTWQLDQRYKPGYDGAENKLLPEGALDYNTRYRAGIVGGICGMAYATIIKGCTNAVEFTLDNTHTLAGGIAGTAGYNTVIESCAFTGGMTLTGTEPMVGTTVIDATFGGIVGLLSPNMETNTMGDKDNFIGSLTVRNCYNSGYFIYTGADMPDGMEMHWGGILGHATKLATLDANRTYLIENCYNVYEKAVEPALADNANYWIGGIVGKANVGDYHFWESLNVKNCASVAVAARGGDAAASTNEYRMPGTASFYGKLAVLPVNVSTASANEIEELYEIAQSNARLEELIKDHTSVGTTWHHGNGAPDLEAAIGDLYLDLNAGDVYKYVISDNALAWELIGNIKGEDGKDGAAGTIDSVLSIGANGNWFINGEDTGVKAQGDKGDKGDKGDQGAPGADAVAPTVEIRDGYWYINGVNTNVKAEGVDGEDGADAVAPTVEIRDGYWYINGVNTNVKAEGVDGEDGADAVAPTVEIRDGYWYINGVNTNVKAEGIDGEDGADGTDGAPGAPGADGADGEPGEKGEAGANGTNGADGKTPELRINDGQWEVSYDGGSTWTALGSVADSNNGELNSNGSSNGSATESKGGNGLAVTAIVLSVVLAAANVALVVVMTKKKKA
ncbi:MAG: hypothetical protein E7590_01285 [Ruminococcaceae bacterium]|nr:hypothetical protein [Oscillospiraceae bacterium]